MTAIDCPACGQPSTAPDCGEPCHLEARTATVCGLCCHTDPDRAAVIHCGSCEADICTECAHDDTGLCWRCWADDNPATRPSSWGPVEVRV